VKTSDLLVRGLGAGALAGLAGGLVSGAALSRVGALPPTASLVRADAAIAGFVVHVLIAVALGAGFGLLVWYQRSGAGETLFWGLTYGALWWFLGPLTLMSLLLLGFLAWDVHSAQEALPSLIGYLLYGGVTGLALALLRRDRGETAPGSLWGVVGRGALTGLVAAWPLGVMLHAQGQLHAFAAVMAGPARSAAWIATLLIGVAAGAGYALLYPRPPEGTGPGLVRGTVYGFFWWIIGPLTVLPLASAGKLAWSLEAARAGFPALPAFLLFGAALAVGYQWLDGLVRVLFSDMVAAADREGLGTEGLRAVGRGALAGLVGGTLFTLVMIQIGALGTFARLIGSASPLAGLVVQVVIADLIGVSYGLLFRRQSYDVGSALGWGLSYGFFWWILGPLTLQPLFLGTAPRWTAEVAAGLFPSLIGHLAFGAGLGVVFHLLEARHNPWWVPRSRMEAARVARRKEQVLTSAPALWTLVVAIALVLPIILGM